MWKQVLDMLWRTLRLAEDTQQNRQDIKAVEKRLLELASVVERENQQLRRANDAMAFEIKRLNDELQHQREREEAERKILKLELENHLLRQERGLLPAKPEVMLNPDAANSEPNEAELDKP